MQNPRFRHDYLPIRLAEPYRDHLVVVGETRNVLIDDPVAVELATLLDGTRALGQVVGELVGRHSAGALARALRRLDGLDLLAGGPCATPRPAAAAWDARAVAPDRAEQWRRDGRVLLVDAGSPTAADLATRLGDLGPPVTVLPIDELGLPRRKGQINEGSLPDRGRLLERDGLIVVAAGSMIDPRLGALNEALLAAGRPWLMVRPHGHVLLLGPHFRPGTTGCWECLRRRWTDNEEVINFVVEQRRDRDRPSPAWAALAATTTALAGLLAAELPVLAVAGDSPRVTGRMVSLDTRDLSTGTHTLVRLPQCPACGDPARLDGDGPRVTVADGPLAADDGTGSRARPAAETLRLLEHQVSPYLGVVTRLTPTGGDSGGGMMFGFTAGHNFALARGPERLRGNLRGLSGGKGRTETQARVSAIGEAIERYCGVWRGDRPTHRATFRDLGRDRAVPMSELRHFSARQYAERDLTNPRAGMFHHVPAAVADDTELDWTTGWSLTHDRPCDLPAAYVWYGHPESTRLGPADSNGCAAGGTLGEAILQGFYELVERDAVALWWYHRSRLPGVDLAASDDPWPAAVRRHYRTVLGRELWVLDLTADLRIPVYAAVSERDGGGQVLVGFGAHPSAAVALTRAVSELNQFLPLAAAVAGANGGYHGAEPETARWLGTVTTADQPWLRPDPDQPPTTPAAHPVPAATGTSAAVAAAVGAARNAGLELIVVDQSRPELELAVARVVVPGLRHFWRRLGPGRLWAVPAALGRAPRATAEDEINPLSVFF
ncbi:TOMM precursor leader peptide-binding protein [Actinoplanes sichuanensis]|uniref:TOMM leader peptide-binding protein n=1 Tax=Actinoplanes sichuanensis TaxID=512349 RepID=A0ABW4AD56_9ACTN|nr:TOMM precursor leader peptide-binding protein [Actinoplanes sichuanensis]BEL08926.1 TOMM precursor leader peptide-binding protein [Actinoplanes sichuanensis]